MNTRIILNIGLAIGAAIGLVLIYNAIERIHERLDKHDRFYAEQVGNPSRTVVKGFGK